MSETAPNTPSQPPEQLPGQEQLFEEQGQLFTEKVVGHDATRFVDYEGRWSVEGEQGPDFSPPEQPQPIAQQTETQPTAELPTTTAYESKISRGLDRLARFFEKGAEKTDKGMERAKRFGKFLGRTATKGQATVSLVKERVGTTREAYKNTAETPAKRIGHLASKALVELPARGAEKAARHLGGNMSELRQENAQARAGYARTQAEMLAREITPETDELERAKKQHQIVKLQQKEVRAQAKAEVHAARAHKRRTSSSVRLVSSEAKPEAHTAKAA